MGQLDSCAVKRLSQKSFAATSVVRNHWQLLCIGSAAVINDHTFGEDVINVMGELRNVTYSVAV